MKIPKGLTPIQRQRFRALMKRVPPKGMSRKAQADWISDATELCKCEPTPQGAPTPMRNELYLGGEKFEFTLTPATVVAASEFLQVIRHQHAVCQYQVDDLDAAIQRRSIIVLDEINRFPWLNWAGLKTPRWVRIKEWFRRKWNA